MKPSIITIRLPNYQIIPPKNSFSHRFSRMHQHQMQTLFNTITYPKIISQINQLQIFYSLNIIYKFLSRFSPPNRWNSFYTICKHLYLSMICYIFLMIIKILKYPSFIRENNIFVNLIILFSFFNKFP